MKWFKGLYKNVGSLNNESMEGKKILKMEKRLQMLIALILFTPTILSSLGSDVSQQNKFTLTWGIIVAIYIGIYIYCEALEDKLSKLSGSVINWSVWVHLGAFVPFFICIGFYQDVIGGVPLIIFATAMAIVFGLPLFIIVVLGFLFMLDEFFSFIKTIRHES